MALIHFVHLPKAAGTTFNSIVQGNVPAGQLHHFQVNQQLRQVDVQPYLDLSQEQRQAITFTAGHLGKLLEQFEPDRQIRYLTIAREPLDRIASSFAYIKNHSNHHAAAVDQIADYLQMDHSQNRQAKLIAGYMDRPVAGRHHPMPAGMTQKELTQQALQTLEEDYLFCGISERFDETLLLCRHYLGWQHLNYRRLNKGNYQKGFQFPDQLKAQAAELNQADLQVYAYIKQRFEQDLAQLENSAHQLELFHASQEGYARGIDDGKPLGKAEFIASQPLLQKAAKIRRFFIR